MNEMSEVRLIDANALKADIDTSLLYGLCVCFDEIVERQPTIEAEPVRHGAWKYGYNSDLGWIGYFCSVCGKEVYCDTDYGHQLFDFCHNYGAKMDEGVKNA